MDLYQGVLGFNFFSNFRAFVRDRVQKHLSQTDQHTDILLKILFLESLKPKSRNSVKNLNLKIFTNPTISKQKG